MRELLAYSQWAVVEEKLTLRIRADNNGDIYLPTAWYSSEGLQRCDYDWMVSIDWGEEVNYGWCGSENSKIRVWYGLVPLSIHTVIIKPKDDEYGWLRAFCYKGTDIASSLINIISDKSYKWYAVSGIFSGDYFKAYQYFGCNNLMNTDEELLPDTLEIIGDNYRYYEYAGCVKLVSNAEEKILKTVKVIWDNYRAYQYQNCTGINKINMRAINWASVGNNYRLNQFDGMATDRNPVEIYIEGGIEEWGDWWLVNSKVKGVYVYKDLVSDYQTKLSAITSSKIKKNAEWDNLEYEFIEYIGIADSTGKIRIPVGGFSTSGNQDCAYDWMVSVDWGEEEEITGTGSATYVSVGSGLTEWSEHRVVIKPKTIWWWWWRAFGYYNTGAEGYIKELIHDSYKCYASNRTDTGNYYKYATYCGCTNLINSYEKLPTSVVNVWDYYMKLCYMWCSGLLDAFWEVIHKWCSLGSDYRYQEYKNCSSMGIHRWMAWWKDEELPTWYRYDYLANGWDDLDLYITRYEKLPSNNVVSIASLGYTSGYTIKTIDTNWKYQFKFMVVQSGNSWGTTWAVYKNDVLLWSAYAGNAWEKKQVLVQFDAVVWDVITMKVTEAWYGWGGCTNIKLDYVHNSAWIDNSRINTINCFVDDIYVYQNNTDWGEISWDKYKWWYYNYVCYNFVDINRYTRLVWSATIPTAYSETSFNCNLTWWIAVNRNKFFNKFAIAWVDGSYSTWWGDVYAHILEFTLSKRWDLSSISQNYTRRVATVRSRWSWSNYTFAWWQRYAKNDDVVYSTSYNGNQDYRQVILWNNTIESISKNGDARYVASWISDNGYFVWWWLGKYRLNSRYWTSAGKIWDAIGNVWLTFSNDGLKMYTWFETIKEYSLPSPRDTENAVDTGRELSIGAGGSFDISIDWKYLFVYKNWTIYQYTYE